jgi:hypothetical protein
VTLGAHLIAYRCPAICLLSSCNSLQDTQQLMAEHHGAQTLDPCLFALAGDEEARARGTQKSILERKAPPTFPLVIEMRERACWVTHWVEDSVDCLLHGKDPVVQVRRACNPRAAHLLCLAVRLCLCLKLQ